MDKQKWAFVSVSLLFASCHDARVDLGSSVLTAGERWTMSTGCSHHSEQIDFKVLNDGLEVEIGTYARSQKYRLWWSPRGSSEGAPPADLLLVTTRDESGRVTALPLTYGENSVAFLSGILPMTQVARKLADGNPCTAPRVDAETYYSRLSQYLRPRSSTMVNILTVTDRLSLPWIGGSAVRGELLPQGHFDLVFFQGSKELLRVSSMSGPATNAVSFSASPRAADRLEVGVSGISPGLPTEFYFEVIP